LSIQPKPPVQRAADTRHTLHVCCGAPSVRRPIRADLEPGGLPQRAATCRRGWKRLAFASLARCATQGVGTTCRHSRSAARIPARTARHPILTRVVAAASNGDLTDERRRPRCQAPSTWLPATNASGRAREQPGGPLSGAAARDGGTGSDHGNDQSDQGHADETTSPPPLVDRQAGDRGAQRGTGRHE
jgi:hypothetical protein